MILKNVKLYREVIASGKRFLGSRDKRIRGVHYILDMFSPRGLAKKTVLDIGCAGGAICFAVADRAKQVTGIDVSPERINAARVIKEEIGIKNVFFAVANVNKWILKDYDCIFLLNVLHHEKNPEILLSRCTCFANEYLCIEHPKKGYFSSNSAYAESDKKVIMNWYHMSILRS